MHRELELQEIVKPTVEDLGCELWGIELIGQGRSQTVRIFIDKAESIGIEDCELVSRQVSALFDVEDPITEAYTLEVSSPGLDRQLFYIEQYSAYVGSLLKIKLRMSYDGRKNFKGRLVAVKDNEVVIHQEEEEFTFPIETIDKTQVIPEFNKVL